MKIKLAALIFASVAILAVAVILAGKNPGAALQTLIQGSLGSNGARSGTLAEMTPLLFASIGVFFALRAGLFNIGIEGQFLVGALACAWCGLKISGPGGLVVGLVAGMAGGALWALPAAAIKAYRNGHEVITTIMLNNVAGAFTAWAVAGPAKDVASGSPTTALISSSAWIGDFTMGGVTVSYGLVLGFGLTALMAWWLSTRVSGYEFRLAGANPEAARAAGVSVSREIMRAMLVSGAIGGLGGAVQVLAYEHRFYDQFSPGYGFDSLGVALLAGSMSWLLLPASLLFGILAQGGTALDIFGVPKGITTLVLGLIILIAAAIRYRKEETVD